MGNLAMIGGASSSSQSRVDEKSDEEPQSGTSDRSVDVNKSLLTDRSAGEEQMIAERQFEFSNSKNLNFRVEDKSDSEDARDHSDYDEEDRNPHRVPFLEQMLTAAEKGAVSEVKRLALFADEDRKVGPRERNHARFHGCTIVKVRCSTVVVVVVLLCFTLRCGFQSIQQPTTKTAT